jgi:hypothetical protein
MLGLRLQIERAMTNIANNTDDRDPDCIRLERITKSDAFS